MFGTFKLQQSLHHSFHHTVSISQSSSYTTGSPHVNPHFLLPPTEPGYPVLIKSIRRPMYESSACPLDAIVNDLGRSDQPPSEMFVFDPPRNMQPVDDGDEEDVKLNGTQYSDVLSRFSLRRW